MMPDDAFSVALAQLNSDVPHVPQDIVQEVLGTHYGIHATLSRLPGERDLNFRVSASDGQCFALKIINANETPEETTFLTAIMTHVDTGDLPVSSVIRDREGRADSCFEHGGTTWRMRLVGWLSGLSLADATPALALCRDTGRQIARVAQRLQSLDAGASGSRRILWDSSRVDELSSLLHHVSDPMRRAQIEEFLQEFTTLRNEVLCGLRRQIIHNDYNVSNLTVMADDLTRISGLVDFGDACEAPLVNELAVAASYQMRAPEGPIACLAAMTAGFHAVIPLTDAEIGVLIPLLRARLATRIILSEWRASLFPENSSYIRRNLEKAFLLFDYFQSLPDGAQLLHAALTAEYARP